MRTARLSTAGPAGPGGPGGADRTIPVRDPSAQNPWEQWGWVIQSIWLVFLVFPLVSLLGRGLPPAQAAAGVVLVAAFGVAYSLGARHLDRLEKRCLPVGRVGIGYTLLLVALGTATVPLLRDAASSFLPFVIAFGMFAMPVRWAMGLGGLIVLGAVAVAVFVEPDQGAWVVAAIVFAVGVMTGGIRLLGERGAQYRALAHTLELAAERERVARDVHDVLGHSLTVVTVKAELAERLVEADPERARTELVQIQALSRQALAEIRATVGGLRAARLDAELDGARLALLGAGVRLEMSGDPAVVDPRHRTVLAWVLREAVTNVVRHSGARSCRVELSGHGLRVRDDGRGPGSRPEGDGLRGVRERVAAAGGSVVVGPGADGLGTVLEVSW